MSMDQLYQEIILEHSRRPHHHGLREPFDAESHQVNPLCGDEITVRVALAAGDGVGSTRIDDVSYDGVGCSISQASTSLLTDAVIGRPLPEALATLAAFSDMVTSRGTVTGDEAVLGDAVALAGVSRYPNRVKCALLGWMAFKQAASEAEAARAR